MRKRALALLMTATMMTGILAGCGNGESAQNTTAASTTGETTESTDGANAEASTQAVGTPKYVFLFIGDGMSYPQVQLTNYFLSANAAEGNAETVTVEDEEKTILSSKNNLTMMNFPVAGSAQTYDSTSFAPDSASTATSIATGNKTWSGSINVSEDFTQEYETIAEKLKAQKDYKIGIISSVNLNHATPAAFYAHQASRNSYYEIGQELVESGFDYFAGGALLSPTGEDESQKDLYTVAEEAGYKVVKVTDYKDTESTGLPAANVLRYDLEGGASVIVRPSGTEPKIKGYYTTLGKDLAEAQAQKDALAEALKPIFS